MRKHIDIKLVTAERRRNYLVSEPNYHNTKLFIENLLAIEIKKTKTEILLYKSIYLRFTILELSKILLYESWYNYVKAKYGENAKLYYMDTDNFIIHVKTDNIYKNIAEVVETRFWTSNFELVRSLPKGVKSNWVNERWIRWRNHERICWIKSKNIVI